MICGINPCISVFVVGAGRTRDVGFFAQEIHFAEPDSIKWLPLSNPIEWTQVHRKSNSNHSLVALTDRSSAIGEDGSHHHSSWLICLDKRLMEATWQ